jgi:long-subunit acyl-CoA synthetase (AMP-forming)
MSQLKTPLDYFYYWEEKTPTDIFLRQSLGNGQWKEYSWSEVGERVRKIASFIHSRNLSPQSKIALWSANSADWIMVDLAIMLSGHISVPLFPNQSVKAANHVLKECDVSLMFVGECGQEQKFAEWNTANVTLVGMHGCSIAVDHNLAQILQTFGLVLSNPKAELDSLMTIVYSSGTTSMPKGVIHLYSAPAKVTPSIAKEFKISREEGYRASLFSFLPLAHMAERALVEFTGLYSNACISFSAGLDDFSDEIVSVQPTFFFAVPRLWDKFKTSVDSKIPPEAQAALSEEDKHKIRYMLGLSRADMILSSSAPLQPKVHQWYLNMGIKVREVYGMTETFATGTGCFEDIPASGTVGKPLGDVVEVKLSDENEILMRSEGMMLGYYRAEEKTLSVLKDGWFHTGDCGTYDENGNLVVTGRKGDEFKTAKGKFIHPVPLEKCFSGVPEIEQFIVVGQGLNQPILLATRSESACLLTNSELRDKLKHYLSQINTTLAPYERISHILISRAAWTIDNGMLTPTLKYHRKTIEGCFKSDALKCCEIKEEIVFV